MGKVFFGATFTLDQTDKEYSSRIRGTQRGGLKHVKIDLEGLRGGGLQMGLYRGKEDHVIFLQNMIPDLIQLIY